MNRIDPVSPVLVGVDDTKGAGKPVKLESDVLQGDLLDAQVQASESADLTGLESNRQALLIFRGLVEHQ